MVGVDSSQPAVEAARKNAARNNLEKLTEFVKDDALNFMKVSHLHRKHNCHTFTSRYQNKTNTVSLESMIDSDLQGGDLAVLLNRLRTPRTMAHTYTCFGSVRILSFSR